MMLFCDARIGEPANRRAEQTVYFSHTLNNDDRRPGHKRMNTYTRINTQRHTKKNSRQ